MHLDIMKWTLTYKVSPSELFCDGVAGKHALLVEKDVLKTFPDPFMLPFPDSLYIQAKAKNIKVIILSNILDFASSVVPKSFHSVYFI